MVHFTRLVLFFSLPVCEPPMVYVDCGNATAGVTGAECQKSCQTLDMECVSIESVHPIESVRNQISFMLTSCRWTLPSGQCLKSHLLHGLYSTKPTASLAAYVLLITYQMAKVAAQLLKSAHVFTMGIPTFQENQSELAVTTGKSILKHYFQAPRKEWFKFQLNYSFSLQQY